MWQIVSKKEKKIIFKVILSLSSSYISQTFFIYKIDNF